MFTSASLNSSSITPTAPPSDQLTAVMIALSSLVVFVLIGLLGIVIYCKSPFCCKSRAYQGSHADLETSSHHYSSRQTLVGSPCNDLPQNLESFDNINLQSGQLFYVGVPGTYCLPPMEPSLPHLPSYESVRKKDRQRQIHMMIADRFGLNGPETAEVRPLDPDMFTEAQFNSENPPTYDESVRQSLHALQPIEAPFDPSPPSVMPQDVLSLPENDLPQYEEIAASTTSPDSDNDPHPQDSDNEG